MPIKRINIKAEIRSSKMCVHHTIAGPEVLPVLLLKHPGAPDVVHAIAGPYSDGTLLVASIDIVYLIVGDKLSELADNERARQIAEAAARTAEA